MDYQDKLSRHKELLESQYEFPCNYLFKFIVPKNKEQEVRALFPDLEPSIRPSKEGNYLGLSFEYMANSSDLVIAIYEKASRIEGLIAL